MDGVGDYTRMLATELHAHGQQCWLLALSDHHVKKPTECEFPAANGAVPALRLPARHGWPERLRAAIKFCKTIEPDWVSWQIVLYGFDRRGLSFGLGRRLREISGHYKTEIMFHEIWIGISDQCSLKNRIVGRAQRLIIRDLLKKLRPRVVHTHTPLYQHLIATLGCRARILPLFGNIPLAANDQADWLKKKWPEGAAQLAGTNRKKWWIFVLFGSIHPEWDGEDFRQRALEAARKAGKKCLLIAIGRAGGPGMRMLRALQQHEGNSWRVLNLGQQSEEDISQCLLTADFGVSAAPPEMVFKSGTVAAMIEHGLPVVVTRPAFSYRHCSPEVLLIGMTNVVRHFDVATLKKTLPRSLLPFVAAQFVTDLERS